MPRPIERQSSYFPGLDGLRAVAVGLVIAYHVGVPHVGGGLLGVGVFFTLSGYLITSILLTSWHRKNTLALPMFWLRRARRLLPAVILVLLVGLAATAVSRPDKFGEWGSQALFALLYVANWATIAKGDTYFNRFSGPSPFDHLWSLSVEEQFYLLWPIILLFIILACRGRARMMAAVTVAIGTFSMILLAVTAHAGQDATRAYEGTDTRAGGLLWGAALAMLWHPAAASAGRSLSHRLKIDALGVAGLLGIGILVATTGEQSRFIYEGGIALLTLATCAVLVAATHPETIVGRVLALAPLRWVGERTYGIYLWHMPVAAFLPPHTFYGNTAARGTVVIAFTLVMAALSWRFVEDPIRRLGFRGAWQHGSDAVRSGGGRVALPAFLTGALALGALGTVGLVVVDHLPKTSVEEIAKEQQSSGSGSQGSGSSASAGHSASAIAHPVAGRPLRTSCTSVAHIGDSTSLGPGDDPETNVPDATQRLAARYKQVGVRSVTEDVKGARAIIEHFKHDLNGFEAVQAQKTKGFDGCFVIALGMNDAANIDTGGTSIHAAARIDKVMREIGTKQPVLWVTAVTQAWASVHHYENKNMQAFNAQIVAATKRYPNLRVYDWAAEALPHPEWFLENDANHTKGTGSAAKALGMARALAVAFPSGEKPVEQKIVASR